MLVAAWILTPSAALAAGPYGVVQVGNWHGGAYTDDTTGQFSHCAASVPYVSGIEFFVAISNNSMWSLGFAHRAWHLRHGETIPIDLTFDARSRFHVVGAVLAPNPAISLVLVPMPPTSELITVFRRSRTMTALARGNVYAFRLDATSALLPALAACVAQARSGPLAAINIRVPGAGTGPIAVQPGNPPAPSSLDPAPSPPGSVSPPSAEMQIEAIELASNFILKSQLQNPRVLSRTETPIEFASFGAAWRSDEAIGAVRIVDSQFGQNGLDVAAAVAAGDAKACKGKFASGRVSELVDSDVVFRGFALCEDSAGNRSSQFFIVPRRRGGFIIFSVVSTMNTEASRTVVQDDRLGGFRKAALAAAGH